MRKIVEIKVLPKDVDNKEVIEQKAIGKSKVNPKDITKIEVIKRSIDARGRQPMYFLRVELFINESPDQEINFLEKLKDVSKSKEVIIIGAGPAGYFAALELIELGMKPIIFERGKDVQARRKDLRAIQQFGIVDKDSNYCFGEGGAGTYSDGKLYTRSHKRGNIYKILKLLVEHGAKISIMIDAHPHIGSNKLPVIISNIRKTILKHGGEVHFESLVTDIIVKNKKVKGVVINETAEHFSDKIILATGHSARDIYYMYREKGWKIEAKPFALGIRLEHPQPLIDQIQYNQSQRDEFLPAASYKLVCQVEGRGVFSFCMCPGGLVVPAATNPGEIVVNGMSLSRRDSPFANSGIVVAVEERDLIDFKEEGAFAGLAFQKHVEQEMFNAGDGSQQAPAQRMTDFVKGKVSNNLPTSSYIPGLNNVGLDSLLPQDISNRLKKGLLQFGKKMRGYYTQEAVAIGVESRTSSPLKIPRDKETLMSDIEGLYPCGEGAGYAGGILSAAMDGQNIARKVFEKV